jgi:hypothetical protein
MTVDERLIVLVLFGVAVLIAAQGYGLIMHGRELLQPEQRVQSGGRAVYTGLALLLFGLITAVLAVVLLIVRR